MKNKKCSICKKRYEGFGNNAYPINNKRCCDNCNTLVIIERLKRANAFNIIKGRKNK